GLAAQGQGSDDAAGRSSAQGGRDERGAAAGDPLRVRGHLGGGSGSEQAVRPSSSRPPDGAAAGAGLRALDLYA
ncbi:MAG TPA: hypothetical protein PLU79_17275, partial [Burkholderiaceae bacterium]|nr:hypothetical protein [Burkholderiaceae bacterium]